MMKKHLVVAAVIAGVGSLGIMGLASAASNAKPNSLASELAQKFNLKQADVQSQHESKYEDRLAQAVKDGKLTAAQKDQILAKHKELINSMTALKDKAPAERKAAIEQQRKDIEAWEKANTIPAGYLGGVDKGFGHRFGHGSKEDIGGRSGHDVK
jgi:hypothetical protein